MALVIRASVRAARAACRRACTPSPTAWRGAAWALYGLYGYLVIAGLFLLGLMLLTACLRPPYRLPFFLVLPTALLFAALTFEQGAPLVLLVVLGGASLLFGAGTSVLSKRTLRSGSTIWLLIGAGVLGIGAYEWFAPVSDLNPALDAFHLREYTIEGDRSPHGSIALDDIGLEGSRFAEAQD